VLNFSISPGNNSFAGRVSIPDTLARKLSGLEFRPKEGLARLRSVQSARRIFTVIIEEVHGCPAR